MIASISSNYFTVMYLFGASGHAKVILDILEASEQRVEALIDDNENVRELQDYKVLHGVTDASPIIVSIGVNAIRKKVVGKLTGEFGTAVHPTAIVSPTATIDEGTVVMQGAIIQADARVGKHCIVNTGASVDHECALGDYVHISPHATLCGNVSVGEGTWIGAGATVIPGVKIGAWSIIGAGAVVLKDIPDGVVAVGNPCRVIRRRE